MAEWSLGVYYFVNKVRSSFVSLVSSEERSTGYVWEKGAGLRGGGAQPVQIDVLTSPHGVGQR